MNQAKKQNLSACFKLKKHDRIFSFITDPSITLSGTHNEIEFCVFFFSGINT